MAYWHTYANKVSGWLLVTVEMHLFFLGRFQTGALEQRRVQVLGKQRVVGVFAPTKHLQRFVERVLDVLQR